MYAGRELDALVGERVMGRDMTKPEGFKYPIGLPRYSEDIAAAWTVVEHFRARGKGWIITAEPGKTRVANLDGEGIPAGQWDFAELIAYEAPTAPEAICLAALAAVGHPVTR
jgi:hypothetical protein